MNFNNTRFDRILFHPIKVIMINRVTILDCFEGVSLKDEQRPDQAVISPSCSNVTNYPHYPHLTNHKYQSCSDAAVLQSQSSSLSSLAWDGLLDNQVFTFNLKS